MTKPKARSGEAVAAQHRKAGPMGHRNKPRGGARNEHAEYMEEDMSNLEECYRIHGADGYLEVAKKSMSELTLRWFSSDVGQFTTTLTMNTVCADNLIEAMTKIRAKLEG